ncbi:MAG TPA: 6-phosphofructokinase [bacterium]|nr:6-phosphofructokinase [bacterium]
MKRIAVMTTGGDAPGMNAAIRAVVRTAISKGAGVFGVEHGFKGLLENRFVRMDSHSVSGIINRGGTMLQTMRCPEFHKKNVRKSAYHNIKNMKIDGLAVIGGDGSRRGAHIISKESGVPVVFIPGSIDNDVYGTDYTIGFDTAVNVGLGAIDKIRDTAASHERVFIVEVMGRERGFLALEIGLTGGAEIILIPEFKKEAEIGRICSVLKAGIEKGKDSSIIVMAEGVGLSNKFAERIEKRIGMEARYTVLGYIQRGGSPTAASRRLGLTFGYKAVKALLGQKRGESTMVGIQANTMVVHSLKNVIGKERKIDRQAYRMNEAFSI